MCSLAPRRDALGLGAATSFLDRRRGVAAVAPAPATHRFVGGAEVSTAPSQKRGRDVDAASSASALRVRMDKELVALQGLLKKAKLLPRSAPPAEKNSTPAPPRPSASEVPVVSTAAKRTTSQSQPKAATEAANQARITAPAANSKQQQRPVQCAAAAKTEVPKKRRPEELARAAARKEFRQMLLEMEKSALPDETIYPEDLEELGIVFEHVVTRTRKQAWLEDHAKKVKLVAV